MSGKNRRHHESFNAPFLNKKKELTFLKETACICEAVPAGLTNEEDIFVHAMSDVTPIRDHNDGEPFIAPIGKISRTCPCPESVEIMHALHDIVNGASSFDAAHSDEYIQWRKPEVNPVIYEKLRKGRFPVQEYLDLHYLGVHQAAEAVKAFIWSSYVKRLSCVLVVHGRGRNSPNGVPVLKREIRSWLRGGITGKVVLAYATALTIDGGMGALYVLLESSRRYLSIERIQSVGGKARRRQSR